MVERESLRDAQGVVFLQVADTFWGRSFRETEGYVQICNLSGKDDESHVVEEVGEAAIVELKGDVT